MPQMHCSTFPDFKWFTTIQRYGISFGFPYKNLVYEKAKTFHIQVHFIGLTCILITFDLHLDVVVVVVWSHE